MLDRMLNGTDVYHFDYLGILNYQMKSLKALMVKNSVLHDFGFGKVSPAKQL